MAFSAHVDAGKTTLSERILYETGAVRALGRVDRGSTVLDSDQIERERGITVFSDQADFWYGGRRYTLIDTPGHVDFAAETERALSALDAAILLAGRFGRASAARDTAEQSRAGASRAGDSVFEQM